MENALDLHEKPQHDNMYMLMGWRQWADAGSISSGLPKYLAQENNARKIGTIKPDGFYIFQFPGTHDLARPVVRFEEGYATELESPHNDIYYAEIDGNGVIFLIGDEDLSDLGEDAEMGPRSKYRPEKAPGGRRLHQEPWKASTE